jgi:hypothetical protein
MPAQQTSRKIIAFLMVTADGYHETADGDLFWHNVDDEFHLGAGHAALAGAGRSGLELASVRQFAEGNVLLTYLPRG